MVDLDGPPRHLDGSNAVSESAFIRVVFQHGPAHEDGVNGCRLEDVVDLLVDKLLDFQGRSMACPENDSAVYHLGLAREALALRRKRREQQGLIGQLVPHQQD